MTVIQYLRGNTSDSPRIFAVSSSILPAPNKAMERKVHTDISRIAYGNSGQAVPHTKVRAASIKMARRGTVGLDMARLMNEKSIVAVRRASNFADAGGSRSTIAGLRR